MFSWGLEWNTATALPYAGMLDSVVKSWTPIVVDWVLFYSYIDFEALSILLIKLPISLLISLIFSTLCLILDISNIDDESFPLLSFGISTLSLLDCDL